MFSLFSRSKPAPPPAPVPESIQTPSSPKRKRPANSGSITQLRTPSPSVESSSVGKTQGSPDIHRPGPSGPPVTPSPGPLDEDEDLGLISDPTALHSLISSIPPKILHEYVLSHLIPPSSSKSKSKSSSFLSSSSIPTVSSRTLTHLTSFFSLLTPPPRLHCVRCHKQYFDVENDERSCLVPHDDDSAEVEHAGGASKGASKYETLWGCCGKTVEGDGDMGPPDGWCYEGKHTTDIKRARFRADSTPQDDKLTSCVRLRCHDPPSDSSSDASSVVSEDKPKRRSRKRARPTYDEGDDNASDAEAEAGGDTQVDDDNKSASSKGKGKAPAKRKTPSISSGPKKKKARITPEPGAVDDDGMDIDVPAEDAASVADSAGSKSKPKSKTTAKPKSEMKKTTTKPSMKPKPKPRSTAPAAPLSPTHSASTTPGSPKRSALASGSSATHGHKKSNVSFSEETTVRTFKEEKPVKRKTKKLSEVVPSSVDGESMMDLLNGR